MIRLQLRLYSLAVWPSISVTRVTCLWAMKQESAPEMVVLFKAILMALSQFVKVYTRI